MQKLMVKNNKNIKARSTYKANSTIVKLKSPKSLTTTPFVEMLFGRTKRSTNLVPTNIV